MEELFNRLSPYTTLIMCISLLWYSGTRLCVDLDQRRWRKRLREERTRREAAETANKAKAVFLTSMSHEVRAPLNAIVGFTDLALKSSLSPELREYLGTVRASADWLSHVANQILECARMEAGALELVSEPFSIREILRSAVNIADPLAAQRKLLLRLHVDAALPNRVRGDSTRLLQVVFNLIENAIRFTTSGSILVTALVDSRDADSLTCRIAVADTGIGIAPERVAHIFEPLTHPVASLDRRARTCGFGLPICQRLVKMMGGTIEVQSRPGIGSTFSFCVPFEIVHQEKTENPAAPPVSQRRLEVVVADNNAPSRLLATVLLQGAGHQVTEATTGLEVLKLLTAGTFDLVLIGLEMPELSGIETAKAIRATEPANRSTPSTRWRCRVTGSAASRPA